MSIRGGGGKAGERRSVTALSSHCPRHPPPPEDAHDVEGWVLVAAVGAGVCFRQGGRIYRDRADIPGKTGTAAPTHRGIYLTYIHTQNVM